MSQTSIDTIETIVVACSRAGGSAGWWAFGAAVITVVLSLLGKWHFDRRAERREALSFVRAAFAELGAQVVEVERVGLIAALKVYQEGLNQDKHYPLIVDLPDDHLHVTKLAIQKCGHLGMDVTTTLAELHHGAQAVYTSMRTIQKVATLDAAMLGDFQRKDLLRNLHAVLAVQVAAGVDQFKFARQKFARLL